jgi:hypothetical protein
MNTWEFRNLHSEDSMAVQPKVRSRPLVSATMMCDQLRALEQAAAVAQHCEAICKDMVATAYCRAGMLCDLVTASHGAQDHAESVNAAFLSILQTVEFATDELYRYEAGTSFETLFFFPLVYLNPCVCLSF